MGRQEGFLTIRLTSELKETLIEHCQKLEVSRAELVKRSLEHYLSHLEIAGEDRAWLDKFARDPTVEKILIQAIKGYVQAQKIIEEELRKLESRQPTKGEQTVRTLSGEG